MPWVAWHEEHTVDDDGDPDTYLCPTCEARVPKRDPGSGPVRVEPTADGNGEIGINVGVRKEF